MSGPSRDEARVAEAEEGLWTLVNVIRLRTDVQWHATERYADDIEVVLREFAALRSRLRARP